jgi:hypothetical protein
VSSCRFCFVCRGCSTVGGEGPLHNLMEVSEAQGGNHTRRETGSERSAEQRREPMYKNWICGMPCHGFVTRREAIHFARAAEISCTDCGNSPSTSETRGGDAATAVRGSGSGRATLYSWKTRESRFVATGARAWATCAGDWAMSFGRSR